MLVHRVDKISLTIVLYCFSSTCVIGIDEPLSKGTHQVCAFGAEDNTISCMNFDIVCDTSSSIIILNAICGIRTNLDYYKLCIPEGEDCKIYNDCCRNERGDKRRKMDAIHRDDLSRSCSKKRECHVPAPVQLPMQDANTIQYCSVLYRCIPVPTNFTPTGPHDNTEELRTSDMPFTRKNDTSNVSTKPETETPLPFLRLTAIIVPVVLVILAIVIGTVILLRRRRMNRNRSPDIKNVGVQNNFEHRISNTYNSIPSGGLSLPGSVSVVHSTAYDNLFVNPEGTFGNMKNRDCNNYITFESENPTDIDRSSNVYHVIEGQDQYNVIDPKHATRRDISNQTKERATSNDYHAVDFKGEMGLHDEDKFYAAMTELFNTEDNVQIDDNDKDIPFDADNSPYHILDPHDPYTARAIIQAERQSLGRNDRSATPEIDKYVSTPGADVNPYHILEPLDANTIFDVKHIHKQMPEVTVETSAGDDDYNKISFKTNTVRNDMLSGTMETTTMSEDFADYSHLFGNDKRQSSVSFLDDTGEYSHLGDTNTSGTKFMCDPDNQYSHISLQQENRL